MHEGEGPAAILTVTAVATPRGALIQDCTLMDTPAWGTWRWPGAMDGKQHPGTLISSVGILETVPFRVTHVFFYTSVTFTTQLHFFMVISHGGLKCSYVSSFTRTAFCMISSWWYKEVTTSPEKQVGCLALLEAKSMTKAFPSHSKFRPLGKLLEQPYSNDRTVLMEPSSRKQMKCKWMNKY